MPVFGLGQGKGGAVLAVTSMKSLHLGKNREHRGQAQRQQLTHEQRMVNGKIRLKKRLRRIKNRLLRLAGHKK